MEKKVLQEINKELTQPGHTQLKDLKMLLLNV